MYNKPPMFVGDEVGSPHTRVTVNNDSPENIDAFVYFEKRENEAFS